jgi:NAD(P)-dependent dehydrogenase (short-subunit alcohol dehydrogenase family)
MTAVARRFASLNCTVSIAGRSDARGKSVLWDINLANPGPRRGKFYKVDLASMADIQRFTDQVSSDVKSKGLDYLVLCAGGPPTGRWKGPTPEVSPSKQRGAAKHWLSG